MTEGKMGIRVPWNEQEAIIIVDAFYQVKSGLLTRKCAVKSVSDELRRLAELKGAVGDVVFRNENGISMQMATLEHIHSNGKNGLRSGSKLFRNVMQLYMEDTVLFQNKLMEAKVVDKKIEEVIDAFLLSRFAYGIKVDSPIEMIRFRRFYIEDYGEECSWDDEEIRRIISEKCFLYEGKGFLISENTRTEILAEINELRENGAVIIYYQELYEKNEEWFYKLGIYSAGMLKGFLQKYSVEIICRKSYFSWLQGTENELLKEYIQSVWGNNVLRDYSNLKECMEYVPVEKIKYALANNNCFVWNSFETYTREEMFVIDGKEEKEILDFVQTKIQISDYVSFDEIPLKTIFDENYELSETAIFALIFNKLLSTEYVKNNRAISKKGIERNAVEWMEEYCKSKREVTVNDLFVQWELRTGTHRQAEPLDIAYSTMIRVDAERFVSDEQVVFNEPSIDQVLDHLVLGEMLGLKEITSFALFPDCNFPWSLYLLESFCRRFSKTFKYMAVTTNSRNAGAIVRKECNFDYHTLLAHALVTKNVTLSEDVVMDYLYDSGYIARHSYKYLQELIDLAMKLKEGR